MKTITCAHSNEMIAALLVVTSDRDKVKMKNGGQKTLHYQENAHHSPFKEFTKLDLPTLGYPTTPTEMCALALLPPLAAPIISDRP